MPIESLKWEIKRTQAIDFSQQCLFYENIWLNDEKKLIDYQIIGENTIKLDVKLNSTVIIDKFYLPPINITNP